MKHYYKLMKMLLSFESEIFHIDKFNAFFDCTGQHKNYCSMCGHVNGLSYKLFRMWYVIYSIILWSRLSVTLIFKKKNRKHASMQRSTKNLFYFWVIWSQKNNKMERCTQTHSNYRKINLNVKALNISMEI